MLIGHISILDWFGSGWKTGIDEEQGHDGEEEEEVERREVKRLSCGIETGERAVGMNSESDGGRVEADDSGWTWVQREEENAIPICTSEIEQDEEDKDTSKTDQDERAVIIHISEVYQNKDDGDEDGFKGNQDEDDEGTDSDKESEDCLFMKIPRKH